MEYGKRGKVTVNKRRKTQKAGLGYLMKQQRRFKHLTEKDLEGHYTGA